MRLTMGLTQTESGAVIAVDNARRWGYWKNKAV